MRKRRKDAPLTVKIAGDRFTIEIGIDTLAFAFEEGEQNNPFNAGADEFQRKYRIVDKQEFASDVRAQMQDEAEDGSSPLTRFLDKMFVAAVEDGTIGVEKIPLTHFKCLDCEFVGPITTEEIEKHRVERKCSGTTVGIVAPKG